MISLQRILILLRADILNEVYLRYLEFAYDCMSTCAKDFEMYKLLLKKLEEFEKRSSKQDTNYSKHRDFVANKNKKQSLCNNWIELEQQKPFLIEYIHTVINLIRHKQYEQAYDFTDWFHALPEAILIKEKWNQENFRKTYIAPYEEKWQTKVKVK